ncbi:MAG: biotin-dependent carboxyltransferase family protein [Treponemataceae bacterium]|nr:MAG: biotin-dependent carboxyltransferase family protein [Treponemataceae bacterium]
MSGITITDAGLMSCIEDLGRYGFQRYGVSVSGAMDEYAARFANYLAGNGPDAAVIEMTLKSAGIAFDGDTVFAVTGADCGYKLNDTDIPMWTTLRAKAGDVLTGGFSTVNPGGGLRGYIAFGGGIDVPVVMNSRSLNIRGKFGGYNGRALKVGDAVRLGTPSGFASEALASGSSRAVKADYIPGYPKELNVRVVMGPQDDAFSDEGIQTFLRADYTVSNKSDRMGIRFEGEKITHKTGADIISDGTVKGTVQVPGDGAPIVLMAESQTTGGYTKIATVISADLPRLAQIQPGSKVRFNRVSLDEALAAYREQRAIFDDMARACE